MNKRVLGIVIGIIFLIAIIIFGWLYFNMEVDDSTKDNNTSSISSYTIVYQGVELYVGMSFNDELIDEEYTYSEIVSCAFDGIDKVYTYEDMEIIVASIDSEDIIYSIYFISDEVETKEGIRVSDSLDDMLSTYGDEYTSPIDNEYVYELGDTELIFIVSNDYITSIELVLITE